MASISDSISADLPKEMSIVFSILKCFGFTFNLVCVIISVGIISIGSIGLQYAKIGSDEHAYFIVSIVLASMVCLITIFGCYGIICELMSVNLFYALFLGLLLGMQYMQTTNFQPHTFYQVTAQHLEQVWLSVKTAPHLMGFYETNYHCCALYNAQDYSYLGMTIPTSCYHYTDSKSSSDQFPVGCLEALQKFYNFAARREKLMNWAFILSEGFAVFLSLLLSLLIYRQRREFQFFLQPVEGFLEPRPNHIESRSRLISN